MIDGMPASPNSGPAASADTVVPGPPTTTASCIGGRNGGSEPRAAHRLLLAALAALLPLAPPALALPMTCFAASRAPSSVLWSS
jgi:hypothetical protein